MNIKLTHQQYIAIMRILLDIIHADGRIDARETFFYDQLKDEFGFTQEDYQTVEKKNSLLALAQVKEMSEDEKEYLAQLMSRMIIIDEDINVNEVAIYELVCDFCGIKMPFNDIVSQDNAESCAKS